MDKSDKEMFLMQYHLKHGFVTNSWELFGIKNAKYEKEMLTLNHYCKEPLQKY